MGGTILIRLSENVFVIIVGILSCCIIDYFDELINS